MIVAGDERWDVWVFDPNHKEATLLIQSAVIVNGGIIWVR
jgi:hypothetical protein